MINPLYSSPSECSGCRVCMESCPINCISMEKDSEHFVYPVIDEDKCVDCHKCEKACPLKNSSKNSIIQAEVGVHSDEEVFKSASGGAFWALCELLIPQGFYVAGVRWDEKFNVIYDIFSTLEDVKAFRKSKYVMPDTNGIYSKVKSLIKEGKKVLFTGCPCQVAACKKYVGESENLLLVDLVCHGAPNQDVFNKEVGHIEQKHKGKLTLFEFKNKVPVHGHINSRTARYVIDSNEYYVGINDDPFLKGYYSRLFYRPSCSSCHFASPERVGDITLADAWGVNTIFPDFNDMSGTSLILFNTDKGLKLKSSLASIMTLRNVDVDWAIATNRQLNHPTTVHKKRMTFFSQFDEMQFKDNVDLCIDNKSLIKKCIKFVYASLRRSLRR